MVWRNKIKIPLINNWQQQRFENKKDWWIFAWNINLSESPQCRNNSIGPKRLACQMSLPFNRRLKMYPNTSMV